MKDKHKNQKKILYPEKKIKKNIDGIFVLREKRETSFSKKDKSKTEKHTDIRNNYEAKKNNFINRKEIPNINEPKKEKKKKNKVSLFFITAVSIALLSFFPIKVLNTAKSLKAQAKNTLNYFEEAYTHMKESDYEKAKKELLKAQKEIRHIQNELIKNGQKNHFLTKFLPIKNMTINNENLLDIVESVSNIGVSLIDDISNIQKININELENNKDNQGLFYKIEKLNEDLNTAKEDFEKIKEKIGLIDEEKLNKNERVYFNKLKSKIEEIEKYYYSLLHITKELPDILGENYDKKYLLLFQNNTEIRATGGFVGTYGILTVKDAKIKRIFIDSIYNPDGQISKKIEPPDPLKKITSYLAMRDANWYPDFPTSAKNISDIYEIEGGFTADGIIAFDTNIFIDILEFTGPIKLEKYGVEISKDNFISETQYKTSIDYNPDDKNPKKFLGDLAPIVLDRITKSTKEEQSIILDILIKNILEKHIQFYSPKENIQKVLSDLNLSGEIKKYEKDYFLYVNSNIGGMKTNLEIEEEIKHYINIEKNREAKHTVKIERIHNGSYDWPSGINYSYMRFYLPKGSKIINIDGFVKSEDIKKDEESGMLYLVENMPKADISDIDIYEENGKTVVGVWQVIKPGEKINSYISYQLPFKMGSDNYKLLIQKQAGVVKQNTNISISSHQRKIVSPKTNKNTSNYEESFELSKDKEIIIPFSK